MEPVGYMPAPSRRDERVIETPEQWVASFMMSTPADQLRRAEYALKNSDTAWHCTLMGQHEHRIERQRKTIAEKDRLIKELDRELDRAHDYITSLLAELNRVE